MMAFKHETPICRALVSRGRARLLASLLAALSACRAGLPPEPPGADPADPNAPAAQYQVQANPYEISAFADAPAEPRSGHEHMGQASERVRVVKQPAQECANQSHTVPPATEDSTRGVPTKHQLPIEMVGTWSYGSVGSKLRTHLSRLVARRGW